MISLIHTSLFLYFVLLTVISASADEAEPLFNDRDLSGWVEVGTPGAFEVKDGAIYVNGKSPYPSWLRTESTYENFILSFEYKTEGWFEGGILFHAPVDGPASKLGVKMHIRHDPHEYGKRSPGALYDLAAPLEIANKPSGEWNRCRIEVDYPRLNVELNGTLIHDIDMSEHPGFRHRLRSGHIGIQNIGCRAHFRNIEIQQLPSSDEWIDLFEDGLEHFNFIGETDWSLEDGVLTGRIGDGFAITNQSFAEPYELQVWVRTQVNGNGGVNFNMSGDKRGVEIQCFNAPDSTNPTGSLYHIEYADRVVSRDEEWFLIHLIAEGSSATVFVNGEKVVVTDSLPEPYQGQIGFQQHTHGAVIHYRDARLKPLR